jgi:YD repeat-containing protein
VNYNPTTHRIDSIADSVLGTFSFSYDAIDRVTNETGPDVSNVYGYDDLDRLNSLTAASQTAVSYHYDARGQMDTSVTFGYDALGRLTSQTCPNGVVTSWGFNDAGFLTSMSSGPVGAPFEAHTFTPDAVGNIVNDQVSGSYAGPYTWTYHYDDLYRLTSATRPNWSYSYADDLVGNRTSATVNGGTDTYVPDAGDHPASVDSVDGVPLSYAADGNLIAYGNDTRTWDVRNRLVGLSRPGLLSRA